jgi:hypothetical protein
VIVGNLAKPLKSRMRRPFSAGLVARTSQVVGESVIHISAHLGTAIQGNSDSGCGMSAEEKDMQRRVLSSTSGQQEREAAAK